MSVHLGSIIKQIMYEKRMTPSQLADELGFTREAVYRMVERGSFRPELMLRISEILDHNLFQYYYTAPPVPATNKELEDKVCELEQQIIQLKELNKEMDVKIQIQTERIKYLEEINLLLKSKK